MREADDRSSGPSLHAERLESPPKQTPRKSKPITGVLPLIVRLARQPYKLQCSMRKATREHPGEKKEFAPLLHHNFSAVALNDYLRIMPADESCYH